MVTAFSDRYRLPTAAELPDCDHKPVDNELQNTIPNHLKDILSQIWPDRQDWFWGVDMGIYHDPDAEALVPDGFLSLGVDRRKESIPGLGYRLSYVLWEEQGIIPVLFFEVISKTYNQEYSRKKEDYAALGVLYYVIYNPLYEQVKKRRRRKPHVFDDHQPFEVYKLVNGRYELQVGNPVWLPEIGLGIGSEVGTYQGDTREFVYWYNEVGQRYLSSEEQLVQERQRAEQEQQRAEQERQRAEQEQQRAEQERQKRLQLQERLKQLSPEQLRLLGIDPDEL